MSLCRHPLPVVPLRWMVAVTQFRLPRGVGGHRLTGGTREGPTQGASDNHPGRAHCKGRSVGRRAAGKLAWTRHGDHPEQRREEIRESQKGKGPDGVEDRADPLRMVGAPE